MSRTEELSSVITTDTALSNQETKAGRKVSDVKFSKMKYLVTFCSSLLQLMLLTGNWNALKESSAYLMKLLEGGNNNDENSISE